MSLIKKLVSRVPILVALGRLWRDRRMSRRPAVDTPFGFKFSGIAAMQRGDFEKEETELFLRLLERVETVVNIGANVGFYCCFACREKKHVIAFEPGELNLPCLYRNLQVNGWTEKVEVFPIALSDAPGLATFYGSGIMGSLVKGWAGNSEKVSTTVPVNTLDGVLGGRLGGTRVLVVLDVEGAEPDVLKGAQEFLRQEPRPLWMVEVNITEHYPDREEANPGVEQVFGQFWRAGYESWTATSKPRRVLREEVEAIAAGGEDTLHTHNFLFVAAGGTPPGA